VQGKKENMQSEDERMKDIDTYSSGKILFYGKGEEKVRRKGAETRRAGGLRRSSWPG